jgi:threonine aldolase
VTGRATFGSDNHAGAHPAVLAMISEVNAGEAAGYGDDPWTARAQARLRELFGARGGVYFVFNGTGANVFGLSLLLGPGEAVICPQTAHLNVDECGAPERALGCKLLTVPTPDGKLTPELAAARLDGRGDQHRAQPAVVAVSEVTELGTCYTVDELRALGEFCRAEGLRLYLDGARLANAAAHLGCPLADLAAQADVVSFGATKNGAVGAEAVVVMDAGPAGRAPFLRKQQAQLASKMRYLSAQFLALLLDDLWLRNARHANAMAARLAAQVGEVPGVRLWQPVESNAVFAVLRPGHIGRLAQEWDFHVWDGAHHVVRWMTSFRTTEAEVDAFAASVRETAGPA